MTGSSTVEVRFRMDSGGSDWRALVFKTNGAGFGTRSYSLWVNQSDGEMFLSTADDRGEQYWYLPAGTISVGQWYNFASVINRSNGTVQAYLNGAPILDIRGLQLGPALSTGNPLLIGASLEPEVLGIRWHDRRRRCLERRSKRDRSRSRL